MTYCGRFIVLMFSTPKWLILLPLYPFRACERWPCIMSGAARNSTTFMIDNTHIIIIHSHRTCTKCWIWRKTCHTKFNSLSISESSLRNRVGGSLTVTTQLKTLLVGHGGSSAGSYLANPTSPIPSHCAVIILFKSVPWHQLSWLVL